MSKRPRFSFETEKEPKPSTSFANQDENFTNEEPLDLTMKSKTMTKKVHTKYYDLKCITFREKKIPVLLQSAPGPCPLIALANVLLLRGDIEIAFWFLVIPEETVIEMITNYLLKRSSDGAVIPFFDSDVVCALDTLKTLNTGLTVDVLFSSVLKFSPFIDLTLFELLDVRLFHGWVVDPKSETAEIIGKMSYDDATLKIIMAECLDNPDPILEYEAMVAKKFINNTKKQITFHGVNMLHESVEDDELGILFWNDHFSVLFKNKDPYGLYLLVTAQSYKHVPNVVWEEFCCDGASGVFVNSHFRPYVKNPKVIDLTESDDD